MIRTCEGVEKAPVRVFQLTCVMCTVQTPNAAVAGGLAEEAGDSDGFAAGRAVGCAVDAALCGVALAGAEARGAGLAAKATMASSAVKVRFMRLRDNSVL